MFGSCSAEWNKKAKSILAEADLVFLDPDNGLLVKSVGKRSAKSIKYAFYEEVKGYIESGKSVLIYNHRSRKSENEYFDEIEKLLEDSLRVSRNTIQTITFSKGSVRDYFAVPVCAEHYDMIFEAFKDMKYSKWGQSGVCRLHPEWADEIYVKYRTYDEYLFLDKESTHFSEDMSLEDYRCTITRYLMLCGYNYSEEAASSLVRNYDKSIRDSFLNKVVDYLDKYHGKKYIDPDKAEGASKEYYIEFREAGQTVRDEFRNYCNDVCERISELEMDSEK